MDCKASHANDGSAIDCCSPSSTLMDSHATKREASTSAKSANMRPVRPTSTNVGDNGPSDHERLQARNRAAASKCRKRKKAWIGDMEDELATLRSRHTQLQASYADVLQEISQLKTYVLTHAMCDDPNIATWVHIESHGYAKQCTATIQDASGGHDFIHGLKGRE